MLFKEQLFYSELSVNRPVLHCGQWNFAGVRRPRFRQPQTEGMNGGGAWLDGMKAFLEILGRWMRG